MRQPRRLWMLFLLPLVSPPLAVAPAAATDRDADYLERVAAEISAAIAEAVPESPRHLTPCVGGFAGGYPCSNIDLLEFLPVSGFAASSTNSLWGWTDPVTGHEIVLLGLDNGTAFIDIADPENPLYLGKLPTHAGTGSSTWRDVRAYQNHAYIVSDQNGAHGMQVFDLSQLRNVVTPPVTFSETAHYNKVNNTHTLSINESTGYAYLVGTTQAGGAAIPCGGNLHMVSLADPAAPAFVGCWNDGGYIHENQCFVYHGPDTAYTGHEICLAARGSAHNLDILDVTDKGAPIRLDSLHYNSSGYSHQAWFTDDHRYILLNDELDEQNDGIPTRTWIFDAADLDNLVLAGPNGYFDHATPAIDHNLYVRGNFVFESNYKAGLRILRLTDLAQASLTEIGYFDVFPSSDSPSFDGTWNNYPFFASGVVPVTHITQGLFLLRPTNLCDTPTTPASLVATPAGDHQIDLAWTGSGTPGATFVVERALGGCSGSFETIATGLVEPAHSDLTASGQVTYGYRVRELDPSGNCASAASTCDEAATTGSCTAAPAFAGLVTATSASQSACQVDLVWNAATAYCGGPLGYNVYRGASDSFVPAAGNRIAAGVLGTAFTDPGAASGATTYYVVRAADGGSGAEDGNLVHRSTVPHGPIADGTFATGAEVGDPVLDTLAGDSPPEGPAAPEHAGWHLSSARFHAGARSFFSTSSNGLCVSLEAGPLTLTFGESSQLTFWTVWDIEATYDGGIVQVSTDGGATWTQLTPNGGYPDTITHSGNACLAMPPGTPAFSSVNQLTWQQRSVDLSAYAGQTLHIAFRYGTDGGVAEEGWYVDDLTLTHVQLPGDCTTNAVFIERFEGGSFGAWSAVFP